MKKPKSPVYYLYSCTIARTDGIKTEIKNHQKNNWIEVIDPQLWKRIQEEGIEIEEGAAEEIYQSFHQQLNQEEE